MLRENESVTLIFFLHKDPINANIFPEREKMIPPQIPLLANISHCIGVPFVLLIARKVRERYTNGVGIVRERAIFYFVYMPELRSSSQARLTVKST